MRTIALAAVVLLPSLLHAGDVKKADGPMTSLFDGKTLQGWKVYKCQAEVQDGAILLKADNGWVHTERQYGDFVLELEWKALGKEMWDSGVYIRAVPPPPEKGNWPGRNQINLRKGLEGSIKGIAEAVGRSDLVKPGEWNHFRITAAGTTATLEINGKLAWKIDGLKPAVGYIGLQCEVPNGGQFLFRNLRIAEQGAKN